MKYKPVSIRFCYLENSISGFLRAEIVRNICFHIYVFTLNIVSVIYRLWHRGKPLSCSLDFQFHPDTTLQSSCWCQLPTHKHWKWQRSILFWETTVYLELMNEGTGWGITRLSTRTVSESCHYWTDRRKRETRDYMIEKQVALLGSIGFLW